MARRLPWIRESKISKAMPAWTPILKEIRSRKLEDSTTAATHAPRTFRFRNRFQSNLLQSVANMHSVPEYARYLIPRPGREWMEAADRGGESHRRSWLQMPHRSACAEGQPHFGPVKPKQRRLRPLSHRELPSSCRAETTKKERKDYSATLFNLPLISDCRKKKRRVSSPFFK